MLTPVKPNLVLSICCISVVLGSMDVTIVNVALPSIQRDLHASLAGLQWILDAYTLIVASLLMLAGSLSDRFGRRKTFQIGLTLFLLGSLLCSVAHGIGQLVGYRALQGLGASMMNPVALSIIANVFTAPKDRARAVGIWSAVAGVALALGPLLGGLLTQTIGWRAVFWINLPIGALAVILAEIYVPESKAPRARGFDPVGQALVFLGLTSLTYAVIEGTRRGWASPLIVGLFGVCVAALAGFLLYEPRRKDPLVDLRFFGSVPFSGAMVLAVCSFGAFASFLFLNALYLQQVRGLSAFDTGFCTLPLAVLMAMTAPLSGRLVGSRGTRPSLLISGAAFLLSTSMLTHLSAATPLIVLLVAYALFGVGMGMINPAISNTAVAGMPLAQAGVAAAIASTSRQVGAALGVALAGTVVSASRAHGTSYTQATHPIWWAMMGCGAIVMGFGWLSSTTWSRESTEKVAALLSVSH